MTLPFGADDEPLTNPTDRYAVASTKLCDPDTLILAQSFKTIEKLIEGFEEWLERSAEEAKKTLTPVEVIGPGKYRVLTDILERYA